MLLAVYVPMDVRPAQIPLIVLPVPQIMDFLIMFVLHARTLPLLLEELQFVLLALPHALLALVLPSVRPVMQVLE
jgi:hypothetical protein